MGSLPSCEEFQASCGDQWWSGPVFYVSLDFCHLWEHSGPLLKNSFPTDLKNSIANESISITSCSGQPRKQKGFKCWQDYETQSKRVSRREEGSNCYFRSTDRQCLETPQWLSNLVVPLLPTSTSPSNFLPGFFAQLVAMETQNSRGSSRFLGGFCALGWEKKLSILLQNAQLMSLMARTEKLTAVYLSEALPSEAVQCLGQFHLLCAVAEQPGTSYMKSKTVQ